MAAVIGDVLTLALGVAISPLPIIAAVLMLLSPKSRSASMGFLLGWVLGIFVAVVSFTLLASVLPHGSADDSAPIRGVIQVALGTLLLLLGVRRWLRRPRDGDDIALPRWMQAIDTITFGKALGLAFVLAAVNPKNLLLGASAGVAIGSAALPVGESAVVIAVYTVIAASTVAVPVVAYLIAAGTLRGPLDALRGWLEKENSVIMATLLLVIGVHLIGEGLGSF